MSQTTQSPVYTIYAGKSYRPCGCCDICTDPALAYSDCGQPVPVDNDSVAMDAQ